MELVRDNPWLEPYKDAVEGRFQRYVSAKKQIEEIAGSFSEFIDSYINYGLHRTKGGVMLREWAPNAKDIYLAGEFNSWYGEDPRTRCIPEDDFGHFRLFLPDTEEGPIIHHNSKLRIRLVLKDGRSLWKIPAWINCSMQNTDTGVFQGVLWSPDNSYQFHNPLPINQPYCAPLIYMAHVGSCGPEQKVHTFKEFTHNVIPYIKDTGYNTVLLKGAVEHADYSNGGLLPTSYFAPSSRLGTPNDLMHLIDTAHGLGLRVLLEVSYGQAAANSDAGIDGFDGTDSCFFHEGARGRDAANQARLFNFGHPEVRRFLLSNLRFWLNEYKVDGFRFVGVTQMLYTDRGKGNGCGNYFGDGVDKDCVTFLMLANDTVHFTKSSAITIAEDASGMAGLARAIDEGGIGFDYREGIAGELVWQKIIQKRDEDWSIREISDELRNRPYKEKTVAMIENDPLIPEKLFINLDDTSMSFSTAPSIGVDRAMSLLKIMQTITFGMGGAAFAVPSGDEFGDRRLELPSLGNDNSFARANRRIDRALDGQSRHSQLRAFSRALLLLERNYRVMEGEPSVSCANEEAMVVVFERGPLIFAINFHPTQSYEGYIAGVTNPGTYRVVLSTDDGSFGGYSRIDGNGRYFTFGESYDGRPNRIMMYLPARTALVLGRE